MSGAAPLASPRLAGAAWSVLLIVVSFVTVYYAVQFLRFDQLDRAISAQTSGAYWERDYVGELTTLREDIAPWREMPGVRSRARKVYETAGKVLNLPSQTTFLDTANLLQIDPVNGWTWLDIAREGVLTGAPLTLVAQALTMSSVSTPREYTALVGRVNLIMDLWDVATDEQKRQFLSEANLLSRMWAHYGGLKTSTWWRDALARQPDARRDEIEDAYRAYDSTY
ncbi:hypothetical protein [Ancylobacter pratisalsi]|uniref:Uncharacterized protein n=1 Tax=Ancylobacter pratisalsi TaxID=1745854 RepID=A0A6P1YR00_9HYPH|nr:hypothetical protein [Ancylobacter pratisalsi]QIB35465.1 hypothetical protein G3A50_18430 [Ancylobacter pratisalsi]